MTNLFSIFNPSAFLSLPLNWVAFLFFIFTLVPKFWKSPSFPSTLMQFIPNYLLSEFKPLSSPHNHVSVLLIPISLFVIILMNNFLGLFPYVFTPSSHLSCTVSMALPLWLGHSIFYWKNFTSSALAHLVPTGTPSFLMPFMVIIELTSNIIRPITLSVRLAANMVAGHLLLTLLSAAFGPNLIVLLLLLPLLMLILLEMAVACIQAYVFSVLMTLYVSEVK